MQEIWLIVITAIVAITILIWTIKRNLTDKKDFENQLNQDYPHPKPDLKEEEDPEDLKSS